MQTTRFLRRYVVACVGGRASRRIGTTVGTLAATYSTRAHLGKGGSERRGKSLAFARTEEAGNVQPAAVRGDAQRRDADRRMAVDLQAGPVGVEAGLDRVTARR